MFDAKTLAAMRSEMELIQGGVGLAKGEVVNPDSFVEDDSYFIPSRRIITSDVFGADGPSLGRAAASAMEGQSEE